MCMQTMGMALASTSLPNAVCARSAIDYLFGQPEAFDTLDQLGHTGLRREALPAAAVWRQNLLVGFTLYALGLLPFHDVFLTAHHVGLGGTTPRSDAVLRALSCGPVGIGDGPGRIDLGLVRSLIDGKGRLLRPDHPPSPDPSTLGGPVEAYRTEHVANEARWDYVVLLNTTDQTQRSALPADPAGSVTWDMLRQRIERQEAVALAPGEIACVLVAPRHAEIAILGLLDKLVPAPRGILRSATRLDDGWRIELAAPGERFGVWAPSEVAVADQDGNAVPAWRKWELVTVDVPAGIDALSITRR